MKTHALCAFAFVLPLATLPLAAQQASEPTRGLQPGSLSGHVTCADTQRPARLASLRLLRTPTTQDVSATDRRGGELEGNFSEIIETSLDGSYTIANVKPGRYYVVTEYEGYLDPVSAFTPHQLAEPDVATRQRMDRELHAIDVGSGQAVTNDIVLEHGASISGTATYDDGTPAAGLAVLLLARGADDKWDRNLLSRYRNHFGRATTDERGHFHLSGMPPGDYLIEADLALSEYSTTVMPMPNNPSQTVNMRISSIRFSLPLFPGNVWREKLATPITLGRAEDKTGIDLTFPLSTLHPVSGHAFAKDGHSINSGKVSILYPDDRQQLTNTDINFSDQAFHLDFVPEGEYLLAVSGAKDITHYQVENPKGYSPRTHEESKTLRTYPDAEQPLIVKGDTSDVIFNLADPSKAKPQPTANE